MLRSSRQKRVRLTKQSCFLTIHPSRPDRQIEIERSDANYYNPNLYSSDGGGDGGGGSRARGRFS